MARKTFSGGTVDTTVSGAVDSSQTTITLVSGSTFPTTTNGPFVIAIGRGTGTEEKVLVGTRAGNVLSGCTRGYDGSTAQSHVDGSSASHVLDAITIDEANQLANTWTATGDLLYKGATAPARLPVPTTYTSQVLGNSSGVPAWVESEFVGTLRQTMKTTADPGWALMGTTVTTASTRYPTLWALSTVASWQSGTSLVLPAIAAVAITGAVWQIKLQ
jgi:hypothetical protein